MLRSKSCKWMPPVHARSKAARPRAHRRCKNPESKPAFFGGGSDERSDEPRDPEEVGVEEPETTILVRFWIFAGLSMALGLGLFYADFLRIPGVNG